MIFRSFAEVFPAVVYCVFVATVLLLTVWRRKPFYGSAAYLIGSGILIIINRLTIFRYAHFANIDEAQMAANAMRTVFGWLNWDVVEPVTSGPVNSMILAWPYLLGGDITLYTGRLTAAALAWGFGCFAFLAARRLGGLVAGILASFPIFLFFGTTTYFEFVHYSSEHLPVFLICASIYFLVRSSYHGQAINLVAAAFLLGLVPFAKLQGTPIAAAVGLVVLARAFMLDGGKAPYRSAMVIAAAVLPAAIFLVPLLIGGEFDYFVKSYFVQLHLRWEKIEQPEGHYLPFLMTAKNYPIISIIISATSAFIITYLIYLRSFRIPLSADTQRPLLAAVALVIPATLFSIAAPRQSYPHYLLFWIPVMFLLGVFSASLLTLFMVRTRIYRTTMILLFIIPIATAGLTGLRSQGNWLEKEAFLVGRALEAPHSLQWLRPPRDETLLCWGWHPECYVNAAIKPATRFITNENQLYQTALTDYYRTIFSQEFNAARPGIIVDNITPGAFHFNDVDSQALTALPEFSTILGTDYSLVSKPSQLESCPRVYVRRDRKQRLDASRIDPVSVAANRSVPGFDAKAVDDGSVSEMCDDYWLLPQGETGTVEITFHAPTRISSIALLNTRNGKVGDRASQEVEVALMNGSAILAKLRVSMQPFPYWTNPSLPSPIEGVDRARISILSFSGVGGGLNEAKFYRD